MLTAAGAAATMVASQGQGPAARPQPRIPRWRGFNLSGWSRGRRVLAFSESDFEWMAAWGFNFARLPLSYWAWSDPKDWMRIDAGALEPVDDAIEMGRRHGVYINLCLHRIPGYCVNGRELEPHQLFDSPGDSMQLALDAATHHWRFLAERYRDVPSSRLSFDLFNEPPFMADQSRYVEIARALIAAIREVSPERLIVADGADIGQTPGDGPRRRGHRPEHARLPAEDDQPLHGRLGASRRVRVPRAAHLAHGRQARRALGPRKAAGRAHHQVEAPDRPRCARSTSASGAASARRPTRPASAGWGTCSRSGRQAGWGWAMWNLRGPFGIVDSERSDVAYEDFRGHKLDRKMLELLLAG